MKHWKVPFLIFTQYADWLWKAIKLPELLTVAGLGPNAVVRTGSLHDDLGTPTSNESSTKLMEDGIVDRTLSWFLTGDLRLSGLFEL